MNELPNWTVVLLIVVLVANSLLIAALAFAIFKVGKLVLELKPKVEGLITKVDGVTTKVDQLTTTVQHTVSSLGAKAQGVTGAASSMANTTSKVFEKYAPILGIVMTGLKVLQTVNEYRKAHQKPALPANQD